jgi:hypothetical protein
LVYAQTTNTNPATPIPGAGETTNRTPADGTLNQGTTPGADTMNQGTTTPDTGTTMGQGTDTTNQGTGTMNQGTNMAQDRSMDEQLAARADRN